MSALDKIRSLWNKPQPQRRKRSPRSFSMAIKGRDSKIDPYHRSGTLKAIEQPKGQRRFAIDQLKQGDIENANLSDGIRILIDASDALSIAVDTAVDYTVDEFSVEPKDAKSTEDREAVEIVKEFQMEHEKGNEPYLATLKRVGYDIHVEGGASVELVCDDEGNPKKLVNVSPLSLTTNRIYPVDDPRYRKSRAVARAKAGHTGERDNPMTDRGEYDQIIQPTGRGVGDYTVLQDEMYPNPYYVYAPFTIRATEKLGSATIEPALFGVTSIIDLISMIMDFTQGQVTPRGVWQVKDGSAVFEGMDEAEIINLLNSMAQDIENTLDSSDETEALVLAHEIVFTLVGALERANIDGAEMIFELLERIIQRGTKFPRVMFGGRQRGGALNDHASTIEWIAFNRRVRHARNIIMAVVDKLHKVVTGLRGNNGTALLKIVDNDLEMRRIESESLKMKGEAFGAIKQLGIFTPTELRQKFVDPTPNWYDLPTELPEELKMQMQQMQQAGGNPDE